MKTLENSKKTAKLKISESSGIYAPFIVCGGVVATSGSATQNCCCWSIPWGKTNY